MPTHKRSHKRALSSEDEEGPPTKKLLSTHPIRYFDTTTENSLYAVTMRFEDEFAEEFGVIDIQETVEAANDSLRAYALWNSEDVDMKWQTFILEDGAYIMRGHDRPGPGGMDGFIKTVLEARPVATRFVGPVPKLGELDETVVDVGVHCIKLRTVC